MIKFTFNKGLSNVSKQLKAIGQKYAGFNFKGASDREIKNQIVLAFRNRKSRLRDIGILQIANNGNVKSIIYKVIYSSKRKTKFILSPGRLKVIATKIKDDLFS